MTDHAYKAETYYLDGFHMARIREELGGVKASDSYMFRESIEGLLVLGWDKEEIAGVINKEYGIND